MAGSRGSFVQCGLASLMLFTLPFVLVEGCGSAVAEEASTAEKDAFEAAKELGTIEAWDAFLSNHSTGFYADLARAYVKKLTGAAPQPETPSQPAAAAATPAPPPPSSAETEAEELSCAEVKDVKAERSDKAVKLRFVNESEATIIIQWIDFNGALKEYAKLQPGKELVQDTFMTHPWIAAYEEGSCRQLFRPAGDLSVARLLPEKEIDHSGADDDAPASSTAKAAAPVPTRKVYVNPYQKCRNIGKVYSGGMCVSRYAKPSKATVERRAKASCVELGMIYLNGKCAPKTKAERKSAAKNKNKPCPAGTYRNPYGKCQPNETGG